MSRDAQPDTRRPERRRLVDRIGPWVALVLPVLAFLGYANVSDLFGPPNDPGRTSTTTAAPPRGGAPASPGSGAPEVPPTGAQPSARTTAPDPRTEAAIAVSPVPVQAGRTFTLTGSGFRPGTTVTIRDAYSFVGFRQVDASGGFRITFPPADTSFCSMGEREWQAVVGGGGTEQIVASTVVRFCY